ncbi:MAG: hypothetical protein LBQ50_14860 [Planctomycetaceae bacterium]|jgi:hypothetical protein|nr:hypothetical protein [Planctomycetaceae bacterium]
MIIGQNKKRNDQLPSPGDWDTIDTNVLKPLVGFRSMTTEFGFLFRHYWMPSTDLYYRRSIHQQLRGQESGIVQTVRKKMVKCDADRCVWRQKVIDSNTQNSNVVSFFSLSTEEYLCEYNRSKQIFQSNPILDFEPSNRVDNRIQAFLQLSFLNPVLPVPLGFHWHIQSEKSYLDFQIESFERIGTMPVVFVRRSGKLTLPHFFQDGICHPHLFQIEREGISVYALDRSMIIEDRTHDTVRDDNNFLNGLELWTKIKLIKSCM